MRTSDIKQNVSCFRSADDAVRAGDRHHDLPLPCLRRYLISDYSLLSDQYTWSVSLFFGVGSCGYSGTENDSEDRFDRLSGESSDAEVGTGK